MVGHLDREISSVVKFRLFLFNKTVPRYPLSIALIVIELIDINDNRPVLVWPTATDVVELTTPLYDKEDDAHITPIAKMSAEDTDEGDNALIVFSIG